MLKPLRTLSIVLLIIFSGCSNVPYYGGPHENELSVEEVLTHTLGGGQQAPREIYRAIWSLGGDHLSLHKGVVVLGQDDLTLNSWDSQSKYYIVTAAIKYKEIVKATKGERRAQVVLVSNNKSYLLQMGNKDTAWGLSESQAEVFLLRLNAFILNAK